MELFSTACQLSAIIAIVISALTLLTVIELRAPVSLSIFCTAWVTALKTRLTFEDRGYPVSAIVIERAILVVHVQVALVDPAIAAVVIP